ncbi:endonuclease/exonuclease/phosphatase family protein [Streptacidiphilus fuscans]|uniref:Endonuclease/exonuclease/phosphatase family protein n=1 Tax=Streptacidiphilus fuscans TaxID=2789292 RepID=A0A931FH10_9ACTN|nr:endonuclease/exonuclease/phosphatase family protein [Streptacidiphilus fuscans]MBF9071406.1 endonuclease/exonuclease/phosphatase family protein [Streptacidiphilus fuscans]
MAFVGKDLHWRGRDGKGRSTWRRGWVVGVLALLVACVLAFHRQIPDQLGNFGSLTETFLPWVGLAIPVLLLVALLRRSATALAALLAPTLVWLLLFGALLTDKSGGSYDFTAVQHNIDASNTQVVSTMDTLMQAKPDVISLEEITSAQLPTIEQTLGGSYPHHAVEGTVGLWSKYPLTDIKPVDIKIGWIRALRATVQTPQGPLAVYVAHMPSVRVNFDNGFTANQRDHSAEALGEAVSAEPLKKVLLLGDMNGTMNDRALAPVTMQLQSAQGSAGAGFGFSWPSQFPMARIDQIMSRGITPTSAWVLPRTGSDHRPIAAHFEL